VLLIALVYLLMLSWQMTIVALILSPWALIALRFAGTRLQAATQRMLMAHRSMGGEFEETISGIFEIQVFNAQRQRSEQFHEVSQSAAKSTALMRIWIQAGTAGAQVFVALSTVLVLIVGIAFSVSLGLTFAGLVVFVGFVPTLFASVQRIIQAYTMYKSVIPNVDATFELLDTQPTVKDSADAVALGEVRGNVVFEDVVFGYSPQYKVLDGFSFSVEEGEGHDSREHPLGPQRR
jgi:ABC-type multidrug transport system fused ATPase/permease subunit